MGGLFPADNSGIAGALLGLVGLVLIGTVFLLVVDGQLKTGSELSAPLTTGGDADAEIAGLQRQVALLREAHERRDGWRSEAHRLAESRRELARLEDEARRLEEELARERAITSELENTFAAYRLDHRDHLWAAAAGCRMEELRLPIGTVYRKVTIRSVSALGIRISHASGSATIPVRELPADIIKAYHLRHGEARRLENSPEPPVRPGEVPPRIPDEETRPASSRVRRDQAPADLGSEAAEDDRIATLEADAAALRRQISRLSRQIVDAQNRARHGTRRSPPGSLETWPQRAVRLSNLRGQLRSRLSIVETEIRGIDPDYRPPVR